MFDLLKLVLLALGGVAVYGMSTGVDLNELFASVSEHALTIGSEVLTGIFDWLKHLPSES
ncbi:hypothetical protein [Vibrio mediterranei]|uniref:hypothetical protein n=1 Tax=Vibrio mediterranei TaxID=689 RepID=UPI004068F60A